MRYLTPDQYSRRELSRMTSCRKGTRHASEIRIQDVPRLPNEVPVVVSFPGTLERSLDVRQRLSAMVYAV